MSRCDLADFILEELTGECDVCGQMKPLDELSDTVSCGIDTTVCHDCVGGER